MARVCRHYERKDFSGLLAELQSAKANTPEPPPIPAPQPSRKAVVVVSPEARKRASLLSNPKMRYAYSQLDNTIHDRECKTVPAIPDKDFRMLSDFDIDRATCRHCRRTAIIRSGIGDDGKHLNAYKRFFAHMHTSTADLKELIVDNGAQLSVIDKDQLSIKVHEDCWLICFVDDTPLLYHNNYSVTEDYQRIFNKGFHLQNDGGHHTFRNYLNIMIGYSWADHVVHLKAKALAELQHKLRVRLAATQNWVVFSKFSLFNKYYTVIDCNHRLGRILRKNKLRYLVNSRQRSFVSGYQLITCRIPRWQKKKFLLSMDELKEYSVVAGYHDYADTCEQILLASSDDSETAK